MHSLVSLSLDIAQQNLHERRSHNPSWLNPFLHPFPISKPRAPGVGPSARVQLSQESQERLGRAGGAGLVGGGAAGANTDMELQAHSSAVGD